MFSEFDQWAMAEALALAQRGLQTTDPNPRVGCVIAREGRVIGEGWHERAGEPHAEVLALRACRGPASGATAYVTLEPCSHHGRTPPCAEALIEARIGRVVFAVGDPDPRVSGRGAERLRAAGIRVENGLMEAEAVEQNVGFMKRMRTGRPWVRLKLAMSLDGRTALADGSSQWITGPAAREDVQQWRARSSAVMTGVGTVLADDPRLDVRLPGAQRRPLRVVLDSRLRTPPSARLFTAEGEVLILTAAPAAAASRTSLEQRGARIEELRAAAGRLDLTAVLERLAQLQVNELLLEAGATLAGAFVQEALVDELLLYIAPKLLGSQARPLLELPAPDNLAAAREFRVEETIAVGEDVRLRVRPR
jgi:diaminohydroxyphosphoribosylaminopyrimidine deaminase/5-amino-6-(5-phosphoribosylamino)uracil reductase